MIGHYLRFLGSRNSQIMLRCVSSSPAFLFSGEKKTTGEKNTSLSSDVGKPENGKTSQMSHGEGNKPSGQEGQQNQVTNPVPAPTGKPTQEQDIKDLMKKLLQLNIIREQARIQKEEEEETRKKKEEEARKKKEEEETRKKKEEEEEARKKKKEEAPKKKKEGDEARKMEEPKSWRSYSQALLGIGTLICAMYGAFKAKQGVEVAQKAAVVAQKAAAVAQKEAAKKEEEKRKRVQALLQKYGTKELEVKPYYVKDNSIEQYFRSELGAKKTEKLHFYTGLPGSGKSAALRYVINEMRKSGQLVFYCNLRNFDKQKQKYKKKMNFQFNLEATQDNQNLSFVQNEMSIDELSQSMKAIQELPALMDLVASKISGSQRVVFVIDDVNQLQVRMPPLFQTLKEIYMPLSNLPLQGADVYLISSSGSYCQQIQKQSFMKKASQFNLVPQKSRQEKRQHIESIMSHFSIGNYKKTIDYLYESDHNLRRVVESIEKNKDLLKSDDQFFQHFLMQDKYIFKQMYRITTKTLKRHKMNSRILKAILEQGDNINRIDCIDMQNKVMSEKSKSQNYDEEQLENFCNQLDQENLLFYCHVRSHFIQRVFEEKIKEMEKNPPK